MKRRWPIISGWLLALLLAIAVLAEGPAIQSDLGQFLPRGSDTSSALLLDTMRDGPGSRLLLLDLSGTTPPQLAAATKKLANELASTPHFQHILGAGTTLSAREQALLFRYRYLLTDEVMDETTLRESLQQRLQELAIGAPIDRTLLRADPTATYRQLLQRLSDANGPTRHHGIWFSDDLQHALLLLRTVAPAFALDQQEQAVAAVHHAFGKLGQPQLQLQLSGPPLFGIESRSLIRSESQQLTLTASLGVALLILLIFRSLTATVLVALPLLSGILFGAATVVLLFGSLHGIALAFGITLIGLAVDYPIHLFSHGGREETAARIWPTLSLGVITSMVGFSALLLSDLTGLAQMGLFAISGIVAAAAVTRWVLPALHNEGFRLHFSLPVRFVNGCGVTPSWLAPLLLLGSLFLLGMQGESLWESRLERLSPIPSAQLEQDRLLRQRLHAPEPGQLLLLEDNNQEQLLQRCEALSKSLVTARHTGLLDSFDSPSRYLPSVRQQRLKRVALPTAAELADTLATAHKDLPFREGLFQPFIDDIVYSKELQPLTSAALADTLTGARLAALLREQQGRHYALITLGGIHQPQELKRLAESFGAHYLDLPQQAAQLVTHYRDEALQLMALGVVAILLLLLATLRSPRRVGQVILPVFAAITTSAALLFLLDEPLSLFHLASLLLVLGVGLDYGLFVDRCRNLDVDCHDTTAALLVCSATTLLVFGLLALSAVPVLHAVGLTVSIGVLLTLLLTLGGGKGRAMV